ncbi:MAG: ferredoxin [Candidatus Nanoarchaeia archaeon]
MEKFVIELDRKKCIGCGSCAAVAPKFFSLADDGKSELKGAKITKLNKSEKQTTEVGIKNLATVKTAAKACPVNAINIFEKSTEK